MQFRRYRHMLWFEGGGLNMIFVEKGQNINFKRTVAEMINSYSSLTLKKSRIRGQP